MAKQSTHYKAYEFHASSLNPQFINIFIKPCQCKIKLLYSICFYLFIFSPFICPLFALTVPVVKVLLGLILSRPSPWVCAPSFK